MFGRSRSWVGAGQGKSKSIHSLDHLKYMYHVLTKNTAVTDHNRNLLVETIRSITEILIWGDQNDSSVFDFFLEKNMFAFFLNILRQKSGRYVCVQLLQTLNILFENISHETSLYYLLSNNHVNSIIVHKFDFSDEEIMAYYISFLKTLSLKMNNHTVHFFYNEHSNDFALYTEAIKFFNHSESMVRIAVRTITLNVYKVDNQLMLHYIRNKTAVPYFSNLVWFIGSHVIELDNCVQTDEELPYPFTCLAGYPTPLPVSQVTLPLYLSRRLPYPFTCLAGYPTPLPVSQTNASVRRFTKPAESLERSLEINRQRGRKKVQKRPNYKNVGEEEEEEKGPEEAQEDSDKDKGTEASSKGNKTSGDNEEIEMVIMERCKISQISGLTEQNTTDEEKTAAAAGAGIEAQKSRPFLDMVYNALDCSVDDYYALFVLCLLYAMSHSKGIASQLLEKIQLPAQQAERSSYSHVLAERLIRIVNQAAQPDGKIRLATLELSCLLLKQLVQSSSDGIIKDVHLACLEGDEIFLDMFEDEHRSMTSKPLNVEYLMMDASILLPPTGTPLTGIDFVKRLPCGDVERTRRLTAVPVLGLLPPDNSDLIACMVVWKDGGQAQRFLAVDLYQMSLVEPETKRLGWGVVKFAGLLQDMQVTGVEDDSRALNIIIHKPTSNPHAKPFPILQANFIFADHIRCIIAKQRLAKGRIQARRTKMQRIAGFAVAQCINQHSPSPMPSPSSLSRASGSTGHCDSVTASTISTPSATQSPSGMLQAESAEVKHSWKGILSQCRGEAQLGRDPVSVQRYLVRHFTGTEEELESALSLRAPQRCDTESFVIGGS
ncbi:UNVERIFIED_CONTAM: hypothetical protein FKN15_054816 [Acipenser sinensis]